MDLDPVVTNPDHYRPVFENDDVRVLEYTDEPGTVTTPHDHPASVMITLSASRRGLVAGDGTARDVELPAGATVWLPAQRHHGENVGDTPTHVMLVELKHAAAPVDGAGAQLGPS